MLELLERLSGDRADLGEALLSRVHLVGEAEEELLNLVGEVAGALMVSLLVPAERGG